MQFQMLQAAVATERFRARYSRYPASQQELVPEFLRRVPLDPHQGKPYTYAVRGDDFTLKYEGPDVSPFEGPLVFPVPSLEEVKHPARKGAGTATVALQTTTTKNSAAK